MERWGVTYRLRMTLAGYGRDEDYAERFLEAFVATHPEAGPVVSQNTARDTLSVVIAVEAADPDEAWERGRRVFVEGGEASGLEPPEGVEFSVTKVAEDETADFEDRELEPVA